MSATYEDKYTVWSTSSPRRHTLRRRPDQRLAMRAARLAARYIPCRPATLRPARPIVTFTFDDVPESAVSNGARILAEHGSRGTFYLSEGLRDMVCEDRSFYTTAGLHALHDGGHEIGCHTFSHPDCVTLNGRELRDEVERGLQSLSTVIGSARITSFAYPFGSTGPAQKWRLSRRFATCRGVRPGFNLGLVDLAQLKAFQLYDCRLDPAGLDRLIDEAVEMCAWLVFYTHEVEENPSVHGCSPHLFEHAVRAATARGCAILTMRDALAELRPG